jgi:hypothetical protein
MGLAPPTRDRLGVHGPEAFRRAVTYPWLTLLPWCGFGKAASPLQEQAECLTQAAVLSAILQASKRVVHVMGFSGG